VARSTSFTTGATKPRLLHGWNTSSTSLEVLQPLFDGDEAEIRDYHEENSRRATEP
jgi:hypothetical protein